MVMDGTQPKFVPATLTVKSGDVIRFHNKSGGPHSVNFWADSIPANAKSAIAINPSTGGESLDSDLDNEPDGIITVTLNNAPAGTYKFYCLPHLAMGMRGVSRSSSSARQFLGLSNRSGPPDIRRTASRQPAAVIRPRSSR